MGSHQASSIDAGASVELVAFTQNQKASYFQHVLLSTSFAFLSFITSSSLSTPLNRLLPASPPSLPYNPFTQQLLIQPDPISNPIKNIPVPQQTILPIIHPVPLVGEMQKARRHAEALQHVEQQDALGGHDAVVEVIYAETLSACSFHQEYKEGAEEGGTR